MSHSLDAFMIGVSAVGQFLVWAAIAAVALLLRRVRGMAVWQLSLAMLLAYLVAVIALKPLFDTPRPFDAPLHASFIGPRPSGASFPSGHAASSFAAAFALSRAWPAGAVAWFALAVLVCWSRLYLGVHYPVDIVGGIVIGLACGSFTVGRTRWR